MWFGTSVWSPLQKKTDRRETGEGRGGGTPGLLRKKPSVFPSLLLRLGRARGQCEADAKCVFVSLCGGGGDGGGRGRQKDGGAKARQGQSDCVGSHQSSRWLMKLKVRSGKSWSMLAGVGRGALKGASVQTCGRLPHHQQQQHHSPAPCLYACGVYLRACLTTARSLWWTDTRWQQPKCLAL